MQRSSAGAVRAQAEPQGERPTEAFRSTGAALIARCSAELVPKLCLAACKAKQFKDIDAQVCSRKTAPRA